MMFGEEGHEPRMPGFQTTDQGVSLPWPLRVRAALSIRKQHRIVIGERFEGRVLEMTLSIGPFT